MIRTAVIGTGNLGRRHMESMLKIAPPIEITVIDPAPASLEAAKHAATSAPNTSFHTHMESLPSDLDFVVVATNSLPRRAVIEGLLARSSVRHLLLEKVLFPCADDYAAISHLLKACDTKTWVNCPRRMYPFYRRMKETLAGSKELYVSASGGLWGMGCNTVHTLDLIAYLSGEHVGLTVDASRLNDGVIPSKRDGYIEFTGLLTGYFPGARFAIECSATHTAPMTLVIQSETITASVYEHANQAFIARMENNWGIERIPFDTPYQSQLTGPLFEELMRSGTCSLTPFEESTRIHMPMLQAFLNHYSKSTGREELTCPIT